MFRIHKQIKLFKIGYFFLIGIHLAGWAQDFNPLTGKDTLVLERERIEDLPPIERYIPTPLPFQLTHGKDYFHYTPPQTDYTPPLPSFAPVKETPPKPKWKKIYSRYVEGGLGRFFTNEIGIGLGNARHRRHHYFFQYHERSTPKGHLPYARFGTHNIQALYEGLLDKQVLYTHLEGIHQKHYYYGRHFPDSLSEEKILQQYRNQWIQGSLLLGFRSHYDTTGVVYDTPLSLRFYTDRFGNTEMRGNLGTSLAFPLPYFLRGEFKARLGYGNYHYFNQTSQHYYFLELEPKVSGKIGTELNLQGGFKVNYYQLPQEKQTSLYPVFSVTYSLFPRHIVFAHLNGALNLPSRYKWAQENRYLDTLVTLRLQNQKYILEGGLKGSLWKNVDYLLKGFVKEIQNAPVLFTPSSDTLLDDLNVEQGYFIPLYITKLRNYGIQLELRYVVTKRLLFYTQTIYQQFQMIQVQNPIIRAVYHWLPSQWSLGFNYQLQDKFGVECKMYYMGKRPVGLSREQKVIELEPFIDASFTAHYNVSSHFYVQIVGNNLLNLSYQRWYFYTERPLDIMVKMGYNF